MTHVPKKTRSIILVCTGFLLLAVLATAGGIYTFTTLSYDRTMNEYLSPYGEDAVTYLEQNEEFLAEYGEVTLRVDSYSYGFNTPGQYTRLSLAPTAPATAEEFASELSYLTVTMHFSGIYAVRVTYEPTPAGYLEITGWESADE